MLHHLKPLSYMGLIPAAKDLETVCTAEESRLIANVPHL